MLPKRIKERSARERGSLRTRQREIALLHLSDLGQSKRAVPCIAMGLHLEKSRQPILPAIMMQQRVQRCSGREILGTPQVKRLKKGRISRCDISSQPCFLVDHGNQERILIIMKREHASRESLLR